MSEEFYEAAVYDEENSENAYVSTVIRDVPDYLEQHERNRQTVQEFQNLLNAGLKDFLE